MKQGFSIALLLGVAFIALGGCWQWFRNVPPPNDDLRIVPGVGIAGYCEIGMKVSEVKRKCPDVRQISGPDRNKLYIYEIPDWGTWFAVRRGQPIDGLTIEVVSESLKPFRGLIDGGLSFSTGAVSRESVVQVFGTPCLFGTNSFAVFPDTKEAVSIKFPKISLEYLMYPPNGIGFMLRTNSVETIFVTPSCEHGGLPHS